MRASQRTIAGVTHTRTVVIENGTVWILDKSNVGDQARKAGDMALARNKEQQPGSPGWASGLRQLYDSVVDEPLPDTFKDLLSKLDSKS